MQRSMESSVESGFLKIEDGLSMIDQGQDIQEALTPLLDRGLFDEALLGKPAQPEMVDLGLRTRLGSFPAGIFDVCVFNGAGKAILPSARNDALEVLFQELCKPFDQETRLSDSQIGKLETSIPGIRKKIAFLKGFHRRVHILPDSDPCLGAYVRFEAGRRPEEIAGILVMIKREPLLARFLLSQAINRFSQAGDLHFVARFQGAPHGKLPSGFSRDSLPALLSRLESEPGNRFFHQGFQVVVRSLEGGDFLLGLSPSPEAPRVWVALIFAVYLVVSLAFLSFLWKVAREGWSLPFPLRWKMAFFLVLVFGVPALFTFFWGISFQYEEEGVLSKRFGQKMLDSLAAIDNDFETHLLKKVLFYRGLENAWRDLAGNPALLRERMASLPETIGCNYSLLISSTSEIISGGQFFNSDEAFFKWFGQKSLTFRRDWVEAMVDRIPQAGAIGDGKAMSAPWVESLRGTLNSSGPWSKKDVSDTARSPGSEDLDNSNRKFFRGIARSMFDSAGDSGGGQNMPPSPASAGSLIVDSFLEDFDFGLRTFNLSRGSFMRFGALNREDFIFVDLLSNATGRKDYFLFSSHFARYIQSEFLSPIAARNGGFPEPVKFHAVSLFPYLECHPGMLDYRKFLPVFRRLGGGTSEVSFLSTGENGRELVAARRCGKLLLYILVARAPLDIVFEPLRSLRLKLSIAGGGFLLFGIGLILLLNWRFIQPVENLRAGMRAIQRKEFDIRLGSLAEDELGKLSVAFNQALERLGDMELARQIQQAILPQGGLEQDGWEIAGANRMMQAVGGDFYDFFPLSEHRLAFAFGDVAGHGISAGLVTAIAKVGVRLLARDFQDDPEGLLTKLNSLFLDMLQKKKMMTAVFGVLDTEKDQLSIVNAGHCAPLRIDSPSGKALFIETQSTPVGIIKRVRFASVNIPLSGESLILLYSDGLVECKNPSGKVFGFPALARAIDESWTETRDLPVEKLIDAVLGRIAAYMGPSEPDDDRTVLVLRRSLEEKQDSGKSEGTR